jgi:hypothetical protein
MINKLFELVVSKLYLVEYRVYVRHFPLRQTFG